jgi:hypothetical protein
MQEQFSLVRETQNANSKGKNIIAVVAFGIHPVNIFDHNPSSFILRRKLLYDKTKLNYFFSLLKLR